MSLTEAGELLLRHADAIAARLQAAHADLAALDAGDAGPLRIGTYQSVGARVLPALFREFSGQWPDVEITLQESADDRDLIHLVEGGKLDLTFVVLPIDPGPYETLELFRDPYVLVVPVGSPLASRDRAPSLRELVEHPLISNRTCRTTQRVEERLRHAGRDPRRRPGRPGPAAPDRHRLASRPPPHARRGEAFVELAQGLTAGFAAAEAA